MRCWLTLCLLLVISSCINVTAISNQNTIQVKGTLLDPNDAVIVGARITVRAKDRTTRAYTNEEGVVEIEVPVGNYEVEIDATGFKRLVLTNLEVMIGMTKELKFHLEPLVIMGHPICCDSEYIEKVHSPLTERIKPRKFQ